MITTVTGDRCFNGVKDRRHQNHDVPIIIIIKQHIPMVTYTGEPQLRSLIADESGDATGSRMVCSPTPPLLLLLLPLVDDDRDWVPSNGPVSRGDGVREAPVILVLVRLVTPTGVNAVDVTAHPSYNSYHNRIASYQQ